MYDYDIKAEHECIYDKATVYNIQTMLFLSSLDSIWNLFDIERIRLRWQSLLEKNLVLSWKYLRDHVVKWISQTVVIRYRVQNSNTNSIF